MTPCAVTLKSPAHGSAARQPVFNSRWRFLSSRGSDTRIHPKTSTSVALPTIHALHALAQQTNLCWFARRHLTVCTVGLQANPPASPLASSPASMPASTPDRMPASTPAHTPAHPVLAQRCTASTYWCLVLQHGHSLAHGQHVHAVHADARDLPAHRVVLVVRRRPVGGRDCPAIARSAR